MRAASGLLLVLLASVAGGGCAVRRAIEQPKLEADLGRLLDDLDVLPPSTEASAQTGSLWTDAGPGASLFRDPRAYRRNDLLTIVLDERSSGVNESQTDLSRSSEADFGAGVAFGLEKPNPQTGELNINNVLSTSSSSEFSGDGATTRGNRLSGTITVRVMRVLSNGDLVVAGQKTVMVNRERQMLTLVGSVRPADVLQDNRIASAKVGDLTVRLWGRGEVDATIRQGWFMRIMNRIWPF